MLTVRDIASLPDVGLTVVAGEEGLGNEVSWLHVSELADPTQFLEGGEFLLTTGLGVGELGSAQRAYVRRLSWKRRNGWPFRCSQCRTRCPSSRSPRRHWLIWPTSSSRA